MIKKPHYSFEILIQLKENIKLKVHISDPVIIDTYLSYKQPSKSFIKSNFTEMEASFSCPFVAISVH